MSGTLVTPEPPVPVVLSGAHRTYLNDHAVPDEVIAACGIHSEGDFIVFPWRDGDLLTCQRRRWMDMAPAQPQPDDGGPKYLWEAGHPLHLAAWRPARDDGGPVIIAEGTKQSLAVASWAPPQYAVYGMAGCDGWRNLGASRLGRFEGRDVIIMLDADAGSNLNVYEAGEQLATSLVLEGARPLFVPSPAWGKDGIDDYLGTEADPARRTAKLARLVAGAGPKPAARKPSSRPRAQGQQPEAGGLPQVVVNKSRRDVIHEILNALRARWDGTELFCYGGVLTRLREAKTEPLDRGAFLRWLAEGVACYRYTPPGMTTPGRYEDAWPDTQTVEALLASSDEFAPLNRVLAMPFIRNDGSVCAKNGYDAASGTFLAMGNSGMDRLDIPDAPSREQARAAAAWLLDEWLGDMPFKDASSRAGALALVITPFIRGLVPLVPLAVVSGLQIGVGKNLLADCLSIVMTGKPCQPMLWIPDDDDEVRKQILAAFRQGDGLLCFDEAHEVGGAALTRALTAQTYTDRILGVSQMASYPNRATWLALGNNVVVNADMSRRVHHIELHPHGPNPQDRPESAFRHPDLRGWTEASRPEVITRILTVIRAWFAAGRPEYSRGSLMGSFEAWDKMASGILHYAGVPGFLSDLIEKRNEADLSGGYWKEHLSWSHSVFGTNPFTTLQAKNAAVASLGNWSAVPGLDNLSDPGFARKLGQEYARHRNQWSGGLRLTKIGKGFNNVAKWAIEEYSEGTGVCTTTQNGGTPPELGEGEQRGNNPGFAGYGGVTHGAPFLTCDDVVTPVASTGSDLQKHQSEGEQGIQGEQTNPSRVRTRGNDVVRRDDELRDGGVCFPATGGAGGVALHPRVPPQNDVSAGQAWYDKKVVPPAPDITAGQEGCLRTGEAVQPPHVPLQPPHGPLLAFDLEGGNADELFTYQPYDDIGYVRLAGAIGPSGAPVITDAASLVPLLEHASGISGHNVFGYDLLALAYHHGADYDRLAAKATDTEILERQASPPRSRESGTSVDRYGLDAVAQRLGVPGKTDELARLKRQHGGYDKIPVDDPEYRSYLEGDLRASAAVLAAMRERHYLNDPYVAREHRLAALAGRMTLNGFLVDQALLSERLRAGEDRKQQALQLLRDGWGLPLTRTVTRGRGQGKHEEELAVTSPLATDAGRAWLAAQYERYGVPDPPRTAKAGKLALGAEDLKGLLADPRCPGSLRSMLTLMGIVTTTRTVYQTAAEHLAPDGRVHPLNSFRQASGRWSVTSPGLTVFGKRGGKHVERDIFVPDEGHVLMSFDLSQVDMRAMAGHCQDPAYMALFAPGRDAHAEIAAQVGIKRQDAKAIGHGWNYGLGAPRMIRNGLDPELVHKFTAGMEQRFPVLVAWREQVRERGKAGEVLDNGFGRRMACEPSRAYTVAPALMGQGGARDIMGECLLRLDKSLWPLLRVMVHDEIVVSCPKEDARDVARQFLAAMTWQWRDVPILADMAAGMNWGDCSAK